MIRIYLDEWIRSLPYDHRLRRHLRRELTAKQYWDEVILAIRAKCENADQLHQRTRTASLPTAPIPMAMAAHGRNGNGIGVRAKVHR